MSALTIYPDNRPDQGRQIIDFEAIVEALDGIGVRFERWRADREVGDDAQQEEVLQAYSDSVERLKRLYGFQSADVICVRPDHPEKAALRGKFLAEHTHSDFEVRFFVDGKGLFYLHVNGKVYAVLCERGDLISVPAGTTHWFDMGGNPSLKCIRLFKAPEGWVAVIRPGRILYEM
ncbi:MAG: cupin, partial [Pseudomonadota bacterium]